MQSTGPIAIELKAVPVAGYALRNRAAPIGVADWTEAITTSLPVDLAKSLPSIEDIEAELSTQPAAPNEPDSKT